jgi:hypothetical protein
MSDTASSTPSSIEEVAERIACAIHADEGDVLMAAIDGDVRIVLTREQAEVLYDHGRCQPAPGEWAIGEHKPFAKTFTIEGPGDVYLVVDIDDVDQDQVERDMERAVSVLNAHWQAGLPAPVPEGDEGGVKLSTVLNAHWTPTPEP